MGMGRYWECGELPKKLNEETVRNFVSEQVIDALESSWEEVSFELSDCYVDGDGEKIGFLISGWEKPFLNAETGKIEGYDQRVDVLDVIKDAIDDKISEQNKAAVIASLRDLATKILLYTDSISG